MVFNLLYVLGVTRCGTNANWRFSGNLLRPFSHSPGSLDRLPGKEETPKNPNYYTGPMQGEKSLSHRARRAAYRWFGRSWGRLAQRGHGCQP